MTAVYEVCFWVGLLLTLATSLLGMGGRGGHGGHGLFHLGSHAMGHHGQGGPSPFNLTSILTFLTVFGGVGFVLQSAGLFGGVLILLLALSAGSLVAWLLFLALVKIFLKGEQVMDESQYDMTGMIGHVSVAIPDTGVGEIKYVLQDTVRSIGARSASGVKIPKGDKIVVRSIQKGIAIVQDFDDYMS